MPIETRAIETPRFADAAEALCPGGPPRVWSLIVTIFGDTAGNSGVEIGAGPLARILEPLGVTGAAMRVALHRLKGDGWIDSRRVGRSSVYRINSERLAETRAASERIYAAAPSIQTWHVRMAGQDQGRCGTGVQIAPRTWLIPGPPEMQEDALVLSPEGPAPSWLRAKICPPELFDTYAGLRDGLAAAEQMTRNAELDDLAETIALRVLVVHAWRRVILRHPELPDGLFPEGWAGPECRALVATLLDRLPRPTAADIARL